METGHDVNHTDADRQVEAALAAFCHQSQVVPACHPEVRAIQQVVDALVYEDGLTVRRVLEVAGFRDHNVQTRFHAVMGETLWQYITRLRTDAAAHLLDATDAPAYLVGQAVGYSCAATFDRAFKGQRGLPPVRYRRAVRDRRAETA